MDTLTNKTIIRISYIIVVSFIGFALVGLLGANTIEFIYDPSRDIGIVFLFLMALAGIIVVLLALFQPLSNDKKVMLQQEQERSTYKSQSHNRSDMRLEFHDIAVEVSRREGGAVNLNIAEISEVLRHAFDVLTQVDEKEVVLALRRRRGELAAWGQDHSDDVEEIDVEEIDVEEIDEEDDWEVNDDYIDEDDGDDETEFPKINDPGDTKEELVLEQGMKVSSTDSEPEEGTFIIEIVPVGDTIVVTGTESPDPEFVGAATIPTIESALDQIEPQSGGIVPSSPNESSNDSSPYLSLSSD